MRTSKRLLRVVIASWLLVVAAPSTGWALAAAESDGQNGQGYVPTTCSGVNPRILELHPTLCQNVQGSSAKVTPDQGKSESDPVSTSSDGDGLALEWWLIPVALVAAGAAGVIISLREGPRPLN